MPVSLNEPLSMLQRMCEELEYADLLDHVRTRTPRHTLRAPDQCINLAFRPWACVLRQAATLTDPLQRIMYVAAFAVSGYASTANRPSRKPFNPLLGETYEWVHPQTGTSARSSDPAFGINVRFARSPPRDRCVIFLSCAR